MITITTHLGDRQSQIIERRHRARRTASTLLEAQRIAERLGIFGLESTQITEGLDIPGIEVALSFSSATALADLERICEFLREAGHSNCAVDSAKGCIVIQ